MYVVPRRLLFTSFDGTVLTISKAITEMTRRLRARKGKTGLVLANGGVMTYQHVICLSSSPRLDGSPYPEKPPLPDVVYDVPVPAVDAEVDGEAVIEVRRAFLTLNMGLTRD
jgi:hypothetical protein